MRSGQGPNGGPDSFYWPLYPISGGLRGPALSHRRLLPGEPSAQINRGCADSRDFPKLQRVHQGQVRDHRICAGGSLSGNPRVNIPI